MPTATCPFAADPTPEPHAMTDAERPAPTDAGTVPKDATVLDSLGRSVSDAVTGSRPENAGQEKGEAS